MRSLLLLTLILGCADLQPEAASFELAQPGPWQIPSEVEAAGDGQDVPHTEAGRWVGRSGCSGGITAGGQVLREWILAHWPEVSDIGGYACRPINGDSSAMSVHATGRALDIYVETDGGDADNDLGDPLANWLVMHAEEIGVQRIIWDRWSWHSERSPRSTPYGGAHPHHDHLHVEISVPASNMDTAWFAGPMGPPERGVCGEALPREGGVIDDADECFQAFGSETYWRRGSDAGEGGSFLWTNAFESDAPSNWARWRFHVAEAGEYRVEASSVAEFAVHPAVRYGVRHAEGDEEVVVDPSGVDGWTSLGNFWFDVGEEAWVAVHDDYAEALPDAHITVDAIRLVATSAPEVDAGDGEDAGVPDAGVPPDATVPWPDAGSSPDEPPMLAQGDCSAGGTSPGSAWLALPLFVVVRRSRR